MREYLKYTQKNAADAILIFVVGAAFAGAGWFVMKNSRFIGIALMALGAIAVLSALTQGLFNGRAAGKLKNNSDCELILADFKQADDISAEAKVGKTYIFRRKYNKLICIMDVVGAYYVEKMGINQDTECLIYLKLQNGPEEKLTYVYNSDSCMSCEEIFDLLKSRKPDIEVHCKKTIL